jgi:polysaccharide biosynthesis/export protein
LGDSPNRFRRSGEAQARGGSPSLKTPVANRWCTRPSPENLAHPDGARDDREAGDDRQAEGTVHASTCGRGDCRMGSGVYGLMTTRIVSSWVRICGGMLIGLAPALAGCQAMDDHARSKIPQYGVIDPGQPRELTMVSMPPHVLKPTDEVEISVRPAALELSTNTVIVQADGVIDLGFCGDVYVAGLTLAQAELKLAQHLSAVAARRQIPIREPIETSVRLANGSQAESYYVLGAVSTPGKFPVMGNVTVLDAILQAGLRAGSLPEKAYLVRPHPPGAPDQILRIDWFGIRDRGDTLTNYQIFPGDRLIVPGSKPPGLLDTLFGG